MKVKRRPLLFLAVGLVISLPAAYAIAQAPNGNEISEPDQIAQTDPDPTTDPTIQLDNLNRAYQSGDAKAMTEAADAMRSEILSRLPEGEREAALTAPLQPDVPPGTLAYLPPSMPAESIANCEDLLESRTDPLCELILLQAEGKIRAGAFSPTEVDAALKEGAND